MLTLHAPATSFRPDNAHPLKATTPFCTCTFGLTTACADDIISTPTLADSPSLSAATDLNGASVGTPGRDPRRPLGVSPGFAGKFFQAPATIRNRHLVTFRDDIAPANAGREAEALISAFGGHPKYVYTGAVTGFAVVNLPVDAVDRLRAHPLVKSIEDVSEGHPFDAITERPVPSSGGWALDRVDQRTVNLDLKYKYLYDGTGVHVYIVDTGIRGDHLEFKDAAGNSRIRPGAAFINFSNNPIAEQDDAGHGTSVASVAVGRTLGVANNAFIHSVRVSDGSGLWYPDDIVAGLDWIYHNYDRSKPAVVNLSSAGFSFTGDGIRDAKNRLADAGAVVVVAASNDNQNACNWADLRTNVRVINVGASTFNDTRSSVSNWGSCVHLFAPGEFNAVATNGSSASVGLNSGTSFAAPMVAGAAAQILQRAPTTVPFMVKEILQRSATPFTPSNLNGSAPYLLNTWHTYATVGGPAALSSHPSDPTFPQGGTWAVQAIGGNNQWTYKWEVSRNGGPFQLVAGNTTQYTYKPAQWEYATLVIRVTSTTMEIPEPVVVTTRTVAIEPTYSGPCTPDIIC